MFYDLIIVGSGPAGLTAGIYAGRYKIHSLILERMNIGGQIILSKTIENFPGFPNAISTFELIDRFKRQVDELNVPIVMEEVIGMARDLKSAIPLFTVNTQDKAYKAKSLIIASGAYPKRLGVVGENKFLSRGVSYCGTCDAPFFKNKDVFVVGGGDRAVEEAVFLASYANKVTLVHRRNQLRASKILEEKARANPKIEFIMDSTIEEIMGETMVEAVKVKNLAAGAAKIYPCNGVFIFVGIKPNTAFLKDFLHLDEQDFIVTSHYAHTSLDGVFACGDCCKKSLYQVITACGEGAVASDAAHKYLLSLKQE